VTGDVMPASRIASMKDSRAAIDWAVAIFQMLLGDSVRSGAVPDPENPLYQTEGLLSSSILTSGQTPFLIFRRGFGTVDELWMNGC
jgi:hypothetical protein